MALPLKVEMLCGNIVTMITCHITAITLQFIVPPPHCHQLHSYCWQAVKTLGGITDNNHKQYCGELNNISDVNNHLVVIGAMIILAAEER